jgi:hypothetical protein
MYLKHNLRGHRVVGRFPTSRYTMVKALPATSTVTMQKSGERHTLLDKIPGDNTTINSEFELECGQRIFRQSCPHTISCVDLISHWWKAPPSLLTTISNAVARSYAHTPNSQIQAQRLNQNHNHHNLLSQRSSCHFVGSISPLDRKFELSRTISQPSLTPLAPCTTEPSSPKSLNHLQVLASLSPLRPRRPNPPDPPTSLNLSPSLLPLQPLHNPQFCLVLRERAFGSSVCLLCQPDFPPSTRPV